ncbi:hypothetical protein Fsol_00431 [Candidatus Fokinia solitaria]|uniref:Uncharacterized protein n=1 Tax=Candidatus Fokinia solitaria TaxID=1802984 RepID=A0A2U8BS87_9RICK|nr:hypothetical protein [Candidatus Fokinia solitaria]AWD33226.1 hypothetical protein Fsol_00431 [Candidatus Fokinia solitaria]
MMTWRKKIEEVLRRFEELFIDGELNEEKVISLICPDGRSTNQGLTDEIVDKLFEDEEIRRHFFTIREKYSIFIKHMTSSFFLKLERYIIRIRNFRMKSD